MDFKTFIGGLMPPWFDFQPFGSLVSSLVVILLPGQGTRAHKKDFVMSKIAHVA